VKESVTVNLTQMVEGGGPQGNLEQVARTLSAR